ncbi:MAG: hypothetical protein GKC53_06415 [Neisseriaceae bacterium]|nr:MAG: hypothetical protein GKC53_06415 [Neisseriaceae bacterium]
MRKLSTLLLASGLLFFSVSTQAKVVLNPETVSGGSSISAGVTSLGAGIPSSAAPVVTLPLLLVTIPVGVVTTVVGSILTAYGYQKGSLSSSK